MSQLVRIPVYALAAGVLFATSGCVVTPDHDRAYDHRGEVYQRDYDGRSYDRDRDREDRRQAYERCREEGGRDCDDFLHH